MSLHGARGVGLHKRRFPPCRSAHAPPPEGRHRRQEGQRHTKLDRRAYRRSQAPVLPQHSVAGSWRHTFQDERRGSRRAERVPAEGGGGFSRGASRANASPSFPTVVAVQDGPRRYHASGIQGGRPIRRYSYEHHENEEEEINDVGGIKKKNTNFSVF